MALNKYRNKISQYRIEDAQLSRFRNANPRVAGEIRTWNLWNLYRCFFGWGVRKISVWRNHSLEWHRNWTQCSHEVLSWFFSASCKWSIYQAFLSQPPFGEPLRFKVPGMRKFELPFVSSKLSTILCHRRIVAPKESKSCWRIGRCTGWGLRCRSKSGSLRRRLPTKHPVLPTKHPRQANPPLELRTMLLPLWKRAVQSVKSLPSSGRTAVTGFFLNPHGRDSRAWFFRVFY